MRHHVNSILVLAALALTVAPASALAQRELLAETPRGERVQLVIRDSLRQGAILPARQILFGQFVRASTDSVWLRPYHATDVAVARHAITRASVSRGTSRMRSALVLGATWGFGLALGVYLDQLDQDRDHRGRDAAIGGAIGLGGGAVLGAVRPYEHWRSVRP